VTSYLFAERSGDAPPCAFLRLLASPDLSAKRYSVHRLRRRRCVAGSLSRRRRERSASLLSRPPSAMRRGGLSARREMRKQASVAYSDTCAFLRLLAPSCAFLRLLALTLFASLCLSPSVTRTRDRLCTFFAEGDARRKRRERLCISRHERSAERLGARRRREIRCKAKEKRSAERLGARLRRRRAPYLSCAERLGASEGDTSAESLGASVTREVKHLSSCCT